MPAIFPRVLREAEKAAIDCATLASENDFLPHG
jgi:hypothetical protein